MPRRPSVLTAPARASSAHAADTVVGETASSVATVRTGDVTRRELASLMVGRELDVERRRVAVGFAVAFDVE